MLQHLGWIVYLSHKLEFFYLTSAATIFYIVVQHLRAWCCFELDGGGEWPGIFMRISLVRHGITLLHLNYLVPSPPRWTPQHGHPCYQHILL